MSGKVDCDAGESAKLQVWPWSQRSAAANPLRCKWPQLDWSYSCLACWTSAELRSRTAGHRTCSSDWTNTVSVDCGDACLPYVLLLYHCAIYGSKWAITISSMLHQCLAVTCYTVLPASIKLTTDTCRIKKLLKSHLFHVAFWHFVSYPGQIVNCTLQIYICICICCRPTTVHRFLVRGTIEERMHNLLQTVNMPLQCHDAEQTTLTIGDLNKLFEHMSDIPQPNTVDLHWVCLLLFGILSSALVFVSVWYTAVHLHVSHCCISQHLILFRTFYVCDFIGYQYANRLPTR